MTEPIVQKKTGFNVKFYTTNAILFCNKIVDKGNDNRFSCLQRFSFDS